MGHGFLLEGDRSVEAVAVTARVIMKQTADFLEKFVRPALGLIENVLWIFIVRCTTAGSQRWSASHRSLNRV